MKKFVLACLTLLCLSASAFAAETFKIWPQNPPGEKGDNPAPVIELWQPKDKKTDRCMIVCPGGGYMGLAYPHEGIKIANYFNGKGMTVVILKYRVPRRSGLPKHLPAWQDAQRTVRFVRAHAAEWGIHPEKIGIMGFSAGGHLTLMTATSSLTPAYQPIDDLDKTPCHVNFAAPVYPAYVLEDGKDGTNTGKGNSSTLVPDFAFDAKTPPMCLTHGDDDPYSPMNSVSVYHKLRTMNIPAELHIYARVGHGFGGNPTDAHLGGWLDRVYNWINYMNF